MWKTLPILLRGGLDLLVPPLCWNCEQRLTKGGDPLCPTCELDVTRDVGDSCPRCSSTLAPLAAAANVCPRCLNESYAFDAAVRLGPYQEPLRKLLLRMKYPGGEVAAEALAPLFARHLLPKLQSFRFDGVVPMPLHWRRRWQRGFNQCEALARALAQALHVPLLANAIRQVKPTSLQPMLTPAERRDNVRGAFAPRGKLDLADKVLLLVDDVLTTGATAHEASRALRKFKPKAIVVAVLAHESPIKTGKSDGLHRET